MNGQTHLAAILQPSGRAVNLINEKPKGFFKRNLFPYFMALNYFSK